MLFNDLLLIAGCLLLLFFIIKYPQGVQRLLGMRTVRYAGNSLASTLFLTLICLILYGIAWQNKNWRLDLTETGEFTPLLETVELLQSLPAPVHIIGFYTPQLAFEQEQTRQRLDSLLAVTDQLSYEFRDPELNPLEAEQYDLNFNGTLVFIMGEGQNRHFSKSPNSNESEIHAALLKLLSPNIKKLYWLTGHGEYDRHDPTAIGLGTAAAFVEDLGFVSEDLNLFSTGKVPAESTILILIHQEAPLSSSELQAIRDYWQQGGSIFMARDVINSENQARAEEDGLNSLLAEEWGISWRNDIIIDPAMAQAGLPVGFTFIGVEYGDSPIITPDLSRVGVIFDGSRSIATQTVAKVVTTPLVLTSPEAWGEANLQAIRDEGLFAPDVNDPQGRLIVGISAENQQTGGRLVLFGDTGFLTEQNIGYGGNGLLFGNALNWLAKDESVLPLTPRQTINRLVTIPEGQLRALQTMAIWLAPATVLGMGLWVWIRRRQAEKR